jgi:hypothetical protein
MIITPTCKHVLSDLTWVHGRVLWQCSYFLHEMLAYIFVESGFCDRVYTSVPVASHSAEMALTEEMRCARKALAATLYICLPTRSHGWIRAYLLIMEFSVLGAKCFRDYPCFFPTWRGTIPRETNPPKFSVTIGATNNWKAGPAAQANYAYQRIRQNQVDINHWAEPNLNAYPVVSTACSRIYPVTMLLPFNVL